MKYTGPKVRLARKLGIALTPKGQKYTEKRPYKPGQHGMKRRRKMSNYGQQLLEKQRLRFQYNVSERQMRNSFAEATRRKGVTGENLVQILESRLDAAVLRAGFARSIFAARQYVNHGHFLVNGKKVDIPSYRLRVGDIFEIKEKSRKMRCFNEARGTATVPGYLEVDSSGYGAKLAYVPRREEIPVICDEQQVVEFYSR